LYLYNQEVDQVKRELYCDHENLQSKYIIIQCFVNFSHFKYWFEIYSQANFGNDEVLRTFEDKV